MEIRARRKRVWQRVVAAVRLKAPYPEGNETLS
jgi:hypothetical protein